MALTGAYTLVKNQPNLDIGNVPQWHSFDITAGVGAACTEDVPLVALPIGTIVHDLVLTCLVTDTGATHTGANAMLETLGVDLATPDANNMDVAGVTDVKELICLGTTCPLTAADELRVLITTDGTSTVGAEMRLSVLLSRIDR